MAFFSSTKPELKQVPTVTGAQGRGIDTLAMMAQQFPELFQSLGFNPERTTEAFEQSVAAPARQQFAEQTAPAIMERLIGAGAGRSGAAQMQLANAGSQLEQALAGTLAQQLQQREQFSQQAQLQALMQALGLGLGTKTFENVQIPGRKSTFESLLPYLAQGAGAAGGAIFGPVGSAAGSALAGKLFG